MRRTTRAMIFLCRALAIAAFSATGWSTAALGRVVEEVVTLPVEVTDIHRRTYQHTITLTVFRDDQRPKSPFLVLNHGRAGTAAGRAQLGRASYTDNSRYFVDKGFAVFVPTRVGYGVTGGPDVEDSGPCANRDFATVFEAGASQTLKVIEYAKAQPYVEPSRGLLVGQSVGGAITIAVAAKNVEGVVAEINFAGGAGGNPERSPGHPCSEPTLRQVFSNYGAASKHPTLWLYSENDKFWGKDNPHAWFDGFRAKGGSGEFVQLPAYRTDGHPSFTGNAWAWKPAVEKLLSSLGFGP